MAYFNNIIIYFNSEEEYKKYIKWVLKRLYKENIPIIVKKCKFYTKKTDFIRFIIKLGQISINLRQENCRMAGASAGLAPGTIGRIGQSAYVHFFLLA